VKIGIVAPGFSAGEDDWCIPALLELVRVLAEDIDVHVFPLRYPYLGRPYSVYGAMVHPTGGAERRGLGRGAVLGRALSLIAAEHRRRPFSIIHAFWADEPGLIASICKRTFGIPSVVSLAGGELARLPTIGYGGQLNGANRRMADVAVRGADAVTVGSRYLAHLLARRLGRTDARVIPLGVDPGRFLPRDERRSGNVHRLALLNVGSLVPVKDQSTLLRAVKVATDGGASFTLQIVGGGVLERDLSELSRALGIDHLVSLCGSVPFERMAALYQSVDLCVQTSWHEAQGMAVLEAAGCGTATIGTGVGVLPELAPTSSVTPVGDADALGRRLAELANDRGALKDLGHLARSEFRTRFTLGRSREAFLRLYESVAGAY
jgi:glycosyltransferase involved in cell wall biosynthesis